VLRAVNNLMSLSALCLGMPLPLCSRVSRGRLNACSGKLDALKAFLMSELKLSIVEVSLLVTVQRFSVQG
jgi:hypothetical protein